MGLFDKKYCDVCGEKIGLLGNRKLEDGNLCKNCAKKLSPWFTERRHATLSEIKEQLDYREANREAVAAFHTTRTLGDNPRVLIDEDAGKFMVTSARSIEDANPDVIDFSQVTGCRLDINETKTEIMKEGPDGKKVSYTPKRYSYEYDFYIEINVNSPYFDEIRFRLNSSSVEGQSRRDYAKFKEMGEEIKAVLTQARQEIRERITAAATPKTAMTCPLCGATTTPDASGCCEYCGGALNQ